MKVIIIIGYSSLCAIILLIWIAVCIFWAIARRRKTNSGYTKVQDIEKADLASNDEISDTFVKTDPSCALKSNAVNSVSSSESFTFVPCSNSGKSEIDHVPPTKDTANQESAEDDPEQPSVGNTDLSASSVTNRKQSHSSDNSGSPLSEIANAQHVTPTPTEIPADDDKPKLSVVNIDLTAVYCSKKNQLQINVREVSLSNVEYFLNNDAFICVVVSLLPDETYFKSEICPLAENIAFEKASSVFEVTIDELSSKALKVDVFTSDTYSKQNLINEFTYRVATCNVDPDVSTMNPNLPITLSETSRGEEIKVSGKLFEEGEVMFSLSYMPTSGRLMFVAMEARNLCDTPKHATYLRVSLTICGKAMKTVQTTGLPRLSCAVYNESFIFHTPLLLIKDTGIVVTVMVVDDAEQDSPPRELGKVTVGPHSGSILGRSHWQAMLSSPGQPIAQWHVIG